MHVYDNGCMRLCVDYRQLIKLMIQIKDPIQRIGDLMDQLVGEYAFSITELWLGYLQIQVKD